MQNAEIFKKGENQNNNINYYGLFGVTKFRKLVVVRIIRQIFTSASFWFVGTIIFYKSRSH